MDDSLPRHRTDDQTTLPGFEADPAPAAPPGTVSPADRLRAALAARDPQAPSLAEEAMRTAPSDHDVPLLAALIMLVAKQPDRALTYLKRHQKRWVPGRRTELLTALALAQQGHVGRAGTMLEAAGLDTLYRAYGAMPQCPGMMEWLGDRLTEIARKRGRLPKPKPKPDVTTHDQTEAARHRNARRVAAASGAGPAAARSRLHHHARIRQRGCDPRHRRFARARLVPPARRTRPARPVPGFRRIALPAALHGVETHWYQVETVRKVLKQYRGRVLLADEVGLGKTIEAGMVVKEYMLRGMAERMLILTPASLVGQWREEMAEKFGIDCATTHDKLLRDDPAAFWAQPQGDRLDRGGAPQGPRGAAVGASATTWSWWTRRIT